MKTQLTFPVQFVLVCLLFSSVQLYSQGWNVGPGGNSTRNCLSPEYGPAEPEILWSGSLTSVIAQQAVTDDDYLCMPRMQNINDVLHGTKIVMHHLQTGETLWTADLPVDFPATDWRNRVSAIKDGIAYCTRAGNNNESFLYALDAATGDIIWKSEDVVDEGSTEGLAFSPEGDVIVGSMFYMTRISKANGSTMWRHDRLSYDDGGNVVVANGKVYGITNLINNVGIAAYDINTGLELYTSAQLSGGLVQQLGFFAGSDGTIYLPRCQNNPITDSLFALKDTGTEIKKKWAIPIGYTPFATCGEGPDGTIYAYDRSNQVIRVNPDNGDILNTSQAIFTTETRQPRMAIDAAGIVYVTNGGFTSGKLYVFNPDLTLRWEQAIQNVNVGGPAIGKDGTMVVCGTGTNVLVYKGAGMPETTFTRITEGAFVNDGGWSYGMAWADFNNDNYPDLFVTNNDTNNGKLNFLYMNNGDKTFTKITDSPVVTDGGSSYAATAADFNNDNYVDIFVANHNENNFLYLGNYDGTFTKVTSGVVVSDGGKSVGCSWADYNVDGEIDLFVANRDQNNFLYEGSSTGFQKILTGDIVNEIANSSGCAWGDYDNDGYPDLYIANSGSVSNLYHNNHDGTFTKVQEEPFTTDVSSCSGASWGDADNDGDLDLFVSTGQLGTYENWFYQNNGDGTFTKITGTPMTSEATWSSGSAWGDYDKDGDLDLAVGGYDGDNLLFKNDGAGNFEKVDDNAFVNAGNYVEGLAWADYDNDGDLDIFCARNNYFGGNNLFFENDGNNNNWLKIKLIGDGLFGNRQAIGAKIFVYANINGQAVMQMRELTAQSGGGQGGQNDLVQFFGLGNAAIVDSVKVMWNFYEFAQTDVAVNQLLDFALIISDITERPATAENTLEVFPNPATENAFFKFSTSQPTTATLKIFDMQGRLIRTISENETIFAGTEKTWDLQNQFGNRVNPGIYFCKYSLGDESGTQKIIVSQ